MTEESASTIWQKRADEFHMWVGYCIAEWANVDEALFDIFQDCVGSRTQCAIIYYKINQLSSRFELVTEIVRSILPKSDGDSQPPDAWDQAKMGYSGLLNARARIAHQPVEMQTQFGQRTAARPAN